MKLKSVLVGVAACASLVMLVVWAAGHVAISVQLRSDVPVSLGGPLALDAAVTDPVEVDVNAEVQGLARLEPFTVAVDQSIRVPLNLTLDVPLDAKVQLDEVIPVRTTVPIDVVLTEKELDLSHLEIPIDDSIFVDDVINVDTVVPIDSTATTVMGVEVPVKMRVPIKLRVPIRQKVRVHDRLVIGLKTFRVPLHLDLPVNADVPFKREVRVKGTARVPLRQEVTIPLKQRLEVAVPGPLPVDVTVDGHAAARLGPPMRVTAKLGEGVQARIGEVRIDASSLTFRARDDGD